MFFQCFFIVNKFQLNYRMKITNILVAFAIAALAFVITGCESGSNVPQDIKDGNYCYGMVIAKQMEAMKMSDDERDINEFVKGLRKGLEGDSLAIDDAMKAMQARFTTDTPSEDPAESKKVAFNLGVTALGGLAMAIDVDMSRFDDNSIKEGFEAYGKDARFDDVQRDSILKAFFQPFDEAYKAEMEAKQKAMQAKEEADAAGNIEKGRQFLAENAQKEGIVTLESGLQYEIVQDAKGPKPTIDDQVKTHYHGTLITGEIFDSSVERGEPATFPLRGVIPGWQEGIPLMSVGSKYRFYIPHDLAYGNRSMGPKLPAGSTLVFDVELIEINPVTDQEPVK